MALQRVAGWTDRNAPGELECPFRLLRRRRAAALCLVTFAVTVWLASVDWIAVVPAHASQPRLTGWELAIALGTFAAVGWAATRREPAPAAVLAPVPAIIA